MYVHILTPLEIAFGVTLEDVARELPRGAFFDNGQAFAMDISGSALAGSVARCAFGKPAAFAGINRLGHVVYRAERA